MSDEVVLIKDNGTRIEGIAASVQKGKIFIDDGSLPIEEGDHLVRELPNGLEESYVVLDRGFYEGGGSIGSHYQCDVQKESAIPRPTGPKTVIYNLHGTHSRVNIQSHDESTNVQTVSRDDLFSGLRDSFMQEVEDEDMKHELIQKVAELEQAVETHEFTDKYKEFMALAADHVSTMSPFLPALAQLLG